MLRRLGVRGKIFATLAVPVIVLFVGAVILSVGSITDTRLARATSQVVDSLQMQDKFTQALQAERTAAFNFTLERTESEEQYEDAKAVTDAAARNFNSEVEKVNLDPLDDSLVTAIEEAREARSAERLTRVRELFVDTDTVLTKTVEAQYGFIIDSQMEVARITTDRMPDRDLGQVMNAYNAVDDTVNATSLDAKLIEILLQDDFQGLATDRALRSLSVQVSGGDIIRLEAEEIVSDLGLPGVRMPAEFATYSLVRGSLATATPDSSSVTARMTWPTLAEAELNALTPVRDTIRDETIRRADANSSAQTQQTILTIAIVLLALAASVVIALFVARRITGPLIRLTAAASLVRDELPRLVEQVAVPGRGPDMQLEPIPIEDEDEVGRLAEAFNEVNATTMDIAREQAVLRGSIAEMFVNVARRDQVLLSRQLSFLDELERSEEDPNTLANLFRLDHLATRMRRNAESLLVLAGIESGRRVRDPMPLSDVIRTAASEIEQYDRIQLEIQTDPRILAHNALIASHLLAELLENATVFSDPGTPVTVSEYEDDRWVSIVIRDRGLGMTQAEIDLANEKASTYAGGEIAGQSRLGLYVVGRLAYRLGANVRFANVAADGKSGIEVRVMMPRELFLAEADLPLPQPLDPLNRRTQAATQAWVAPEPIEGAGSLQPRLEEPEAPVGIPVDLPALTDGATASGMPRRRSRAADPGAVAPSQAMAEDADGRDIMLPELQSSELPSTFTDGADAAWSPISIPEPQAGALPSREPTTEAEEIASVVTHVEPAPVPKRASMFSSLRTRRDLEAAPIEETASEQFQEPVQQESEEQPQRIPALDLSHIDLSQYRTRTARREALSAASAASALTGEHPVVQAHQLEQNSTQQARQFIIPGLVEDTPAPTWADDQTPSYEAPAYESVGLEPEYPQESDSGYTQYDETQFDDAQHDDAQHEADPATTSSVESAYTPAHAYEPAAGAQPTPAEGDPFNGAVPPGAMAPLPDFSELVGRSARREAAESKKRGFFGFGRRKKKKEQPQQQAPEAMQLPAVPDRSSPAPLTGFTPPHAPAAAPTGIDPAGGQFPPAVAAEPGFLPVEPAYSEPHTDFTPTYTPDAQQPWAQPQFHPRPQQPLAPVAPPIAVEPSMPATGFDPHTPEKTVRRGRDGHAISGFFSGTRKQSAEHNEADAAAALPTRSPDSEPQTFAPQQEAMLPEQNFSFTPDVQEQSWAPTMALQDEAPGEFAPRVVDPSAQFALQTGIQEQALSELSQLSSYRPAAMGTGGGSSLKKRVRSNVPDSTDDLSSQKISRDAAELRARLSSFVSATSRARDDAEQQKNNADGAEQFPDQANPDHAPQSR